MIDHRTLGEIIVSQLGTPKDSSMGEVVVWLLVIVLGLGAYCAFEYGLVQLLKRAFLRLLRK